MVCSLFQVTVVHSNLQSKCFFLGPMISSVVALQTALASPCPAKLCLAASILSLIVWPAWDMVAYIAGTLKNRNLWEYEDWKCFLSPNHGIRASLRPASWCRGVSGTCQYPRWLLQSFCDIDISYNRHRIHFLCTLICTLLFRGEVPSRTCLSE